MERKRYVVSCIVNVTVGQNNFNNAKPLQIGLPFKMNTQNEANTNKPFGTPVLSQRGNTFKSYGGVVDHKFIDVVYVSNYNNTNIFFRRVSLPFAD